MARDAPCLCCFHGCCPSFGKKGKSDSTGSRRCEPKKGLERTGLSCPGLFWLNVTPGHVFVLAASSAQTHQGGQARVLLGETMEEQFVFRCDVTGWLQGVKACGISSRQSQPG